tara:strand:+ start:576 stop:689 length:114 start_codon:yes stop_codon:yes gene_type:complete
MAGFPHSKGDVVKVGIRGGTILEILGPFLPDSYDAWW